MEKEFISYEQALELRELGFNEECVFKYSLDRYEGTIYEITNGCKNIQLYKGSCTAPLYQQAFRWFREKYDLHAYVDSMRLTTGETVYDYVIRITDDEESDDGKNWRTYEEAELACLLYLIKIVKTK